VAFRSRLDRRPGEPRKNPPRAESSNAGELTGTVKSLEKAHSAGGIDSAGSITLAGAMVVMRSGRAVAACG
jgi:hypothetical protein